MPHSNGEIIPVAQRRQKEIASGKEYWVKKTLQIRKVSGNRQYDNEIMSKGNPLALLEIIHFQFCPHCGQPFQATNSWAYSYGDQIKMWEAIFDIKIKPHEKVRQAEGFKKIITTKLQQAKLGFGKM